MSETFDRRHNQQVAQKLKEERLIEMLPEEVDRLRKQAFSFIRKKMAEKGYDLSEVTDAELLREMRDLL